MQPGNYHDGRFRLRNDRCELFFKIGNAWGWFSRSRKSATKRHDQRGGRDEPDPNSSLQVNNSPHDERNSLLAGR